MIISGLRGEDGEMYSVLVLSIFLLRFCIIVRKTDIKLCVIIPDSRVPVLELDTFNEINIENAKS